MLFISYITALPAQISASNFHDLTQITQRRVCFNPKRTEKPKAHGFSVRFGLKHTLREVVVVLIANITLRRGVIWDLAFKAHGKIKVDHPDHQTIRFWGLNKLPLTPAILLKIQNVQHFPKHKRPTCMFDDIIDDYSYLCHGHLTQRDLSGSTSISPRWRGPPACGHFSFVATF